MIDEFQDFSRAFLELIEAIRAKNPGVEFFCVGDDWQAINGFAGSDVRFLQNFESYFRDTVRCSISTNYRSAKSVVEISNALMRGVGHAARPARANDDGLVWRCDLADFQPCAAERALGNS